MVEACIDQAAIRRIAVEDHSPCIVKGDRFFQLCAKGRVPALDVEVEIAVIRSELDEVSELLDHRCRLRHGQEHRLDSARAAPCDREQAGEMAHADAI